MTFVPPKKNRALQLREQQLKEAFNMLCAKHGAQSETAAVIRTRLEEVQEEMSDFQMDRSAKESHTGNIIEVMGGPQVKDAGLMFVILGVIVLVALGGMSTMFVLMMAVKW